MRDCVRRFADAMDAMLTEKEAKYGAVDDFTKKTPLHTLLVSMGYHAEDAVLCPDDERAVIHTANFAMMAWNKRKVHSD